MMMCTVLCMIHGVDPNKEKVKHLMGVTDHRDHESSPGVVCHSPVLTVVQVSSGGSILMLGVDIASASKLVIQKC